MGRRGLTWIRERPLPTNNPTPPKGYTIVPRDASIPTFIRDAVGPVHEKAAAPLPASQEAPGTETVAEALPGTISVYDQSKYTPQVRNHEMTHQFQDTRADGNIHLPFGYELQTSGQAPTAPMAYQAGDPRNYDYGGEAGLVAARNSGKTAAHFNKEQQANLVADYKEKQNGYLAKAQAGKATPADLRAMYNSYQAYHPFVQQMASLPPNASYVDTIKHLLGLGIQNPATPAAPGLPSYDTPGLGVAPADALMGGQSVPLKR